MKISSSLKKIIVSSARLKLINIFYSNINEIFFVRQLVRLAGEEINSIRRELDNLKNANLILPEARGNRLYYGVNPEHPLTLDLINLALKSSGLAHSIRKNKLKIGNIDVLFYSFEYATKKQLLETDQIDILIIGKIKSVKELDTLIKNEEKNIGREINYMIMDEKEYKLRRQKRDSFLIDFLLRSPLIIFGNIVALNNL
jgi:hypothetical protein